MPAKLSLDVKVNHMGLMEDDYPRGFQVLNCGSRWFRGTSLQSRKTVQARASPESTSEKSEVEVRADLWPVVESLTSSSRVPWSHQSQCHSARLRCSGLSSLSQCLISYQVSTRQQISFWISWLKILSSLLDIVFS